MHVNRKFDWSIVTFFALAYAIAWGCLLVVNRIASQSGLESGLQLLVIAEAYEFDDLAEPLMVPPWLIYLISRVADFSFTISGLILMLATRGKLGLIDLGRQLVHWRVSLGWYAVAVTPLFFYFLAAMIAAQDPAVAASLDVSPSSIFEALFGIGSGFVVCLLARGAMGEEPGLRGFALDRLLDRHSPAKAALIVGVLWAGWHVPVLVGKEVVPMVLICLLIFLLSFVFTWIYIGSKRSLIPVMIFHASQNSSDSFEAILPGLKSTEWETASALAMFLFGISICGVLVWQSRGRNKARNDGP